MPEYRCWNCGEAMYRSEISETDDAAWNCRGCNVRIGDTAAPAYLSSEYHKAPCLRDVTGQALAAGDTVVFVDTLRGQVSLHIGPVKEIKSQNEAVCLVSGLRLVRVPRRLIYRPPAAES